MNETTSPVRVTLRIPGSWSDPGELVERLPVGFELTPEALVMPDGTEIEFSPLPPDDQFAAIFRSSCRRPASREEYAVVDDYQVNIALSGPGGSRDSAHAMMQAGAAIVRAGAGGVFIDNSALAHGAGDWLEMTDDGSPDALSFAFASVIRGQRETWTMGMHVLGLSDISMQNGDVDPDGEIIIDVIRYLCHSDKPIGDGHLLGDLDGPRFRASLTTGLSTGEYSPMCNPFGCLKLTSMEDIAESN